MRYETDDGESFEASTPEEVVDRLRYTSFLEHEGAADFMRKVAENFARWDGTRIRHDTPGHFVADLLRCGFLQEKGE